MKTLPNSIHTNANLGKVTPPLKFAEFFAGIGLMRMGLEQCGWELAFANDIDPQKYAMYQQQFNDAAHHFLLGDIHHIDADAIPDITLATASFPCNDLSLAGARAGLQGEQSSAFWGFIRILEEMAGRRPPLVLLENVTGFLTSRQGADFTEALLALNALGYAVDAIIVDAAHFVPQSRQRLFIVGQLAGDDQLREKGKTLFFGESEVRPKALANFIWQHPEIQWNTRDLPPLPKVAQSLEQLLEDLPGDASVWWSEERATYLFEQMSPKHKLVAQQMMAANKWSYGTVFRRVRNGKSMAELRIDGIAGCLRTPRGGSGRQILFKAGYGTYAARLLTPRECARLMGADDYIMSVPLNQALFGFGDAVCVPVVRWIAEHYINPLMDDYLSRQRVVANHTELYIHG